MNLNELYQELIIDHGTQPRRHYRLSHPSHQAHSNNPLCGDTLEIFIYIKDDIIQDISFEGAGCAISIASASIMCEILFEKTIDNALYIFDKFQNLLINQKQIELKSFEKIGALAGVKAYPTRIKCATLAWHTFKSASIKKQQT